MPRFLYSLLFTLLMPFIVVRMTLRARKAPEYTQRWWQRFGFFTKPKPAENGPAIEQGIWFHTVSMGEFIAAAPLIEQTMKANPNCLMTITTTTPTGSAQVQKHFAKELADGRVFHVYLPYDLPWLLHGFLNKIKPSLLIILETELWPNLIHCSKRAGAKVMVVNARLSEKSAKGYEKVSGLAKSMLLQLDMLAVQNKNDAQRFLALGMPEKNMSVTGSIKFDLSIDESLLEQGQAWRKSWGADRKVICLASTHVGEDQIGLDAFKQVREADENALLIIVPRHPERFDAVAKLIHSQGFNMARRSEHKLGPSTQVLLVDSMGELMQFLAASDVCIMGGSFVANGAHNPLEPAALSVPILIGESQFNFALICEQLESAGGLKTVTEINLASNAIKWLSDETLRKEKGAAAKHVVEENRGAKQKVFELIRGQLS